MLLLSSSSLLWADTPWGKDSGQWSDKDVERILSRSPWARAASVDVVGGGFGPGGMGGGGRRAGGRGMGGGAEMESMGGGSGIGGGRGGGMGGRGGAEAMGGAAGGADAGSRPQMAALVRWESALPVRDARRLTGNPGDFYVISVSGIPAVHGRQQSNDDGPSEEDRQKLVEQRLKDSTSLERKGKDPITPEKIDRKPAAILFYFPRTAQPILPADKEVVFRTKLGPMEVRARFQLKDMMYQGKLAL